jgi:Glyoxalase-like domain
MKTGSADSKERDVIHIDHISIAARNLYEAAFRLRAETGLGFYDGGWTESGLASKIFPLGGDAYLQIEGIVDVAAVDEPANRGIRQFYDAVAEGEHFRGLGLRVDTMNELEEIAARRGSKVFMNPQTARIRPDGSRVVVAQTPSIGESWSRGMPNWFFFPEMNTHPSGQRVVSAPNLASPAGVAWIEFGGTESAMTEWLGMPACDFPFRFNGGTAGIHRIAVKSNDREIVISRIARIESA